MTQYDAEELWEELENANRHMTVHVGRASKSLSQMIADWYGDVELPNARISADVIAQRLSRFEMKPRAEHELRDMALEEAAKLGDDQCLYWVGVNADRYWQSRRLASAIRALKEPTDILAADLIAASAPKKDHPNG